MKAGTEAALIADLIAAGLGPRTVRRRRCAQCDGQPDGRASIPMPLIDVAPLGRLRCWRGSKTNAAYHRLSPKFSIQIDGGESVAMVDASQRYLARRPSTARILPSAWLAARRSRGPAIGMPVWSRGLGGRRALFALLDLFLAEIGTTNRDGDEHHPLAPFADGCRGGRDRGSALPDQRR